jgi:hypothetical protein
MTVPGWNAATRLAVASVLVLAAAGCTGGEPDPQPTPNPRPTTVTRRLAPDIQIELTATVIRVHGPNAFVIADADLPPDGQLVVSDQPVTVSLTELVRISGRTAVLDQPALRRYGVADTAGGVAVVAATVRRYLPSSPAFS